MIGEPTWQPSEGVLFYNKIIFGNLNYLKTFRKPNFGHVGCISNLNTKIRKKKNVYIFIYYFY